MILLKIANILKDSNWQYCSHCRLCCSIFSGELAHAKTLSQYPYFTSAYLLER